MNFYADAFTIRKYVAITKITQENQQENNEKRDLAMIEATRLALKTKEAKKIFDELLIIWNSILKPSDENIKKIADIFDRLNNLDPKIQKKHLALATVGGYSQGMADAYSIFVENRLPEDIEFIQYRKEELQKRIKEIKLQNTALEDQILELNNEIVHLKKENSDLLREKGNFTRHLKELGYDKTRIRSIESGRPSSKQVMGK